MHLVTIMGGLGNQLFQYAFARYVQSQIFTRVCLSWDGPWKYERELELDKLLTIKFSIITAKESRYFTEFGNTNQLYVFFVRAIRKLGLSKEDGTVYNFLTTEVHQVRENGLQPVEEQLAKEKENTYYYGYWQSAAMVNRVRSLLLQDLKPRNSLSQKSQDILAKIKNTFNATALHIRGVWNLTSSEKRNPTVPKHSQRTLSTGYYARAIEQVEKRRGPTTLFVFADDINAAAELLGKIPTKSALIYIKHDNRPHWEDLYLMQHCQNFILSNSTFCWWACWLAYATRPQEDRLSIMPRNWLADDKQQAKGKQLSDKLKIAAGTLQL